MDSIASGTYDPLPEGPFLRYIELNPGRTGDPLVCTLHISELVAGSIAPFEAISYTWGGLDRVRDITCQGQSLKITENLDEYFVWLDCLTSQETSGSTLFASTRMITKSVTTRFSSWD